MRAEYTSTERDLVDPDKSWRVYRCRRCGKDTYVAESAERDKFVCCSHCEQKVIQLRQKRTPQESSVQEQIDMMQKLLDNGEVEEMAVVAIKGSEVRTGWTGFSLPLIGAMSILMSDLQKPEEDES